MQRQAGDAIQKLMDALHQTCEREHLEHCTLTILDCSFEFEGQLLTGSVMNQREHLQETSRRAMLSSSVPPAT